MIRVVMLGRTGNNLFQYALGRVLAERHGVPLVMDASWFNAEGWRSVSCLRRLGLKAEIRRGWSLGSRVLRKLDGRHPWEFTGVPVMKEEVGRSGFDPSFLEAPADVVMMGYFQSPRYFEAISESLRAELDLGGLGWPRETMNLAEALSDEVSVAVHVRRTDFVGALEFDLCGMDYYLRAMEKMRSELTAPRFYLFSDDLGWCREHLKGSDARVVDFPEMAGDPLHDLFLMSCCRHHVIANSSYSWWAAWLGKSADQKVIAPDRWFGGDIEAPMVDRLESHWETLPLGG